MVARVAQLIVWYRWLLQYVKWALSHPNPATLILTGVDQESRGILYRRWDDAEPKRPSVNCFG